MKRRKSDKNKNKTIIFILGFLLIILIFLFCFCIFKFVNNFNEKFKIESRVNNLQEYKNEYDGIETVGWIKVQGTNIDYPVWYAPGYNFNEIVDDFAWTEGKYDSLSNITYISGHNIKNLSSNPLIADKDHSRFEQLMSFTYYDFAKDNQFVQYTFKGVDYIYKIYSVSYVEPENLDLYNFSSYPKDKMKEYIKENIDSSIYKYDIDVNENDIIISLDTCTRMFGADSDAHFRVNARMLRRGERIVNSKVEKTSNYDDLIEIMKGGESYNEA